MGYVTGTLGWRYIYFFTAASASALLLVWRWNKHNEKYPHHITYALLAEDTGRYEASSLVPLLRLKHADGRADIDIDRSDMKLGTETFKMVIASDRRNRWTAAFFFFFFDAVGKAPIISQRWTLACLGEQYNLSCFDLRMR